MKRLAMMLLFAWPFFPTWAAPPTAQPQHVSLIQLIATPAGYHGQPVLVSGYLTVGFEDDVLYLGEEDA
jgi:hypothetical protein